MKFLYLANVRMPTEKAHGAQIMKTCEALAQAGSLAALVVTDRESSVKEDPFAYYGVQAPFPLERARVLDTVEWGRLGFVIETISFAWSALRSARTYPEAILYSRDEVVLWFASLLSRRTFVWESHIGAWNMAARRVATRAAKIVVITEGLKEWYAERGVAREKIIVAPDAIDLAPFAHAQAYADARARLELPDTFAALYAGRLDGWKGTDTLLKASEVLDGVATIAVIGGEQAQIASFQKAYPKVRFLGSRPYAELADNLSAADALILPTSGKDIIGARFTSPMKLFGYLAAKKPIIATDVPAHREVLAEGSVMFIPPDNASALAEAIGKLARMSTGQREEMAEAAHSLAGRYTWEARARILQGIL